MSVDFEPIEQRSVIDFEPLPAPELPSRGRLLAQSLPQPTGVFDTIGRAYANQGNQLGELREGFKEPLVNIPPGWITGPLFNKIAPRYAEEVDTHARQLVEGLVGTLERHRFKKRYTVNNYPGSHNRPFQIHTVVIEC